MSSFEYVIGGVAYRVVIKELGSREALVEVNGTDYRVEISSANPGALGPVRPAAVSAAMPVAPKAAAAAPAAGSVVRVQTTPVEDSGPSGRHIHSPLPGLVLEVRVKPGDSFSAGDVLVVIEAMKMENNIVAPHDGRVAEVRVKPHDEIQEGDVLIVVAG
ncbi:MAG: hypothetical protein A2V67_19455 [Deltaproteobacteria bacterium RBG_13_61_14]|nr:MAG: hypothetical protein A2V67_19455 [Deltaproteobacteria bacterium RBG_13_61_14]